MLLVVGSSSQAIATAAFAAFQSGEAVALDPAGGPAPLQSERVDVRLWDGRGAIVHLPPAPTEEPDAMVLFVGPRELHDRSNRILDEYSATPVMYAPATLGGWAALAARRPTVDPCLTGVLAGFPAVGDVTADGVRVRGVKANLPCGSAPGGATALIDAFKLWLPGLLPTTAAEAELNSTNVLLHGPLLLPHIANIARGDEAELFYRPPAVTWGALLAEAVDRERLEVGRALGFTLPTGLELLMSFYGTQGMTGRTIGEALASFAGFAGSRAPASFDHRYLTDDVSFGLAGWAALGYRLGTPMPITSALVEALSRTSGLDLYAHAAELAEVFLNAHDQATVRISPS